MGNVFDSSEAFTSEPTSFVLGDFVQWKRTNLSTDYPTDSYTMELVARIKEGGSSEIKIAATVDDGHYLFTADSATTSDYNAGEYHWQLEVTKTATGDRAVIGVGMLTVNDDLDINGADPRTHAEIMVAKIKSILEGKADSDVSNYAIGGRSLTKMSFTELMDVLDVYEAKVIRQKAAHNKNKTATIKVRFGS